jgi:hypothetical protein
LYATPPGFSSIVPSAGLVLGSLTFGHLCASDQRASFAQNEVIHA